MKKYSEYKDSGIEWIGEIPSHWKIRRLKYFAKICNGKDQKDVLTVDGEYPIYGSGGVFGRANSYLYNQPSVLLGRKGTIDKPLFVEEPFWSVDTMYFTEIKKSTDPKFFFYLTKTIKFDYYKYGSAVPSMTQGDLNEIQFQTPPLDEQTAIANYLDRKTAEIDDLIAKKEQLIELYNEERTATINQAVTKGLDPTVPMKDSGIEWVGEIPEHWEVKRISQVSRVVRGASPRPAGDPNLFNGDFLSWITVKEVTNATGKFITKTETYLTELGAKQTRIVEPETLLLSNSGATLGVPRITKILGGINDGSLAFYDLTVDRDFLYHFFTTHTEIFREEASGYGQPNLNTQIVKSLIIPIPSNKEQASIVNFIESAISNFDSLISKTKKEIDLLKEYKTTLISEVVLGKVDVREEDLVTVGK